MKRVCKYILLIVGIFLISSLPCEALYFDNLHRELRNEIVFYNLINGLYLDEGQMEFILNKAREIDDLRKKLEEKFEAISTRQLKSLLSLRKEVKKEIPQVSKDLARNIHENNVLIDKLRKEYFNALEGATKDIKDILTDTQLYNIKNFKPCLVPPQGPARIGQDSSNIGLVNLLQHIRALPGKRYKFKKVDIVNRYAGKLSLKCPHLKDEEIFQAKEKFLEVIERARNLPDVDFAIQKKTLSEEIKNIISRDKEVDLDKRIAHFLLSPQIISVLEEKLSEKELGKS